MVESLVTMHQVIGSLIGGALYVTVAAVLENRPVDQRLIFHGCAYALAFLVLQVVIKKMGIFGPEEPRCFFDWFTMPQ